MKRRLIFFDIMLTIFLLTSTPALLVKSIKSNRVWETIHIRADGDIDPPDAPIETYDNVTYTLTSNVISSADGIIVEKDNIVIDGQGFAIIGQETLSSKGFYLLNSFNVTIKNITVSNFCFGIYLENSSNIHVLESSIIANSGYGIIFAHSLNSTVLKNNITSNGWDGIILYFSSNNIISENYVTKNLYGIMSISSSNNIISKNNITSNISGIGLSFSSNTYLMGNNITSNNGSGVTFVSSTNNSILENNIMNNEGHGIKFDSSSNNTIFQNNLIENKGHGISFLSSSNNNVVENNVANNECGVCSFNSQDNIIHHNNFVDNIKQAYNVNSRNIWDDGYPSGGNYWSNYKDRYPCAKELNGSGLWNTPYFIDENNSDQFPLMYPFNALVFKLTIVTTSGGTTNPSPGIYTYTYRTTIEVMAIPNVGFSFSHWLLDGERRTGNPIVVLMDGNHILKANFIDVTPPVISKPLQWPPPEDVDPEDEVTVRVKVTDEQSGVNRTILLYTIDDGVTWNSVTMEFVYCSPCNISFYMASIPKMPLNTLVQYKIIAYDNAGNYAVEDNAGQYYVYTVIAEFPLTVIIITLIFQIFVSTITSFWKAKMCFKPKTC